jgi:signal peptidase II
MRSDYLGLLVALMAGMADQLHKYIMLYEVGMAQRPAIEVLPFFNLVMVWNRGVSFGLFPAGSAAGMWMLIGVAAVISGVMLVWLLKRPPKLIGVALGLVIGGAAGNVIDRLMYGAVADFFDFHVGGWHYPAFNLADSWIFIGVMILLWDSFFGSGRPRKTADSDEA